MSFDPSASFTRRKFIAGSAAVAAVAFVRDVHAQAPSGPFKLDPLPYPNNALEPHIDAKTMEIHHDRHHKAYVTNLNNALKPHTDLHKKTLVELVRGVKDLPTDVQMAVRNNGGGHLNHSMFWMMMAKNGGGDPKGDLAKAIESAFESLDKFKDLFSKTAIARFGSGW